MGGVLLCLLRQTVRLDIINASHMSSENVPTVWGGGIMCCVGTYHHFFATARLVEINFWWSKVKQTKLLLGIRKSQIDKQTNKQSSTVFVVSVLCCLTITLLLLFCVVRHCCLTFTFSFLCCVTLLFDIHVLLFCVV